MLELKDIRVDLIDELKELGEEFRYMDSYANTLELMEVMSELKQALIKTTDSVLENDLEEFNNNWQELKYTLGDLENAIYEENETDLSKLDKSLEDISRYQLWNIDRLTNQPVTY